MPKFTTNMTTTVKKLTTFDFSETIPYTPRAKTVNTPFIKVDCTKAQQNPQHSVQSSYKKTKHIITSDIRYTGYNWYLEPIIDTYNDHDYIVGWKLYCDSVDGPIVSEQIVEGDVNDILENSSIFRSRAGIYYQVYDMNCYFAQNIWDPGNSTKLKDLYKEHKLIAYANVRDLVNKMANVSNIEYIEYIKPIQYTIHTADPSDKPERYLPAFLPDSVM